MGMDVFLAVGLGVAIQQMLDAVGQATQPAAVNRALDFLAVDDEQLQQVGQVRRGPVAGDVAFGKTDVARTQRGAAGLPVVQVQAGQGRAAGAEALQRAVGQLQRQRAVFQAAQHFQGGARGARCIVGNGRGLGQGGGVKGVHRVTGY